MAITNRYKILALVGVLAIAAFFVFGLRAHANPSYFERFQTSSATTTLVYVTAGNATTTLTATDATASAFDSALVNMQITATSTGVVGPVTVNARVEGSMDGIDWYPVALQTAAASTTSYTANPNTIFQLLVGTSTSAGPGGSGSLTRIHESFSIPVVSRHLRVVFYDPIGGGTYGLWAEIVTKRQSS